MDEWGHDLKNGHKEGTGTAESKLRPPLPAPSVTDYIATFLAPSDAGR